MQGIVFAPSDDAFATVAGALDGLSPEAVTDLLSYHGKYWTVFRLVRCSAWMMLAHVNDWTGMPFCGFLYVVLAKV
jgi:hypothetical protein